jgi:hypothetical protein
MDNIIKNNNDSTHILFLINSLNTLLANMTNICLNRKRNYLMYKSDLNKNEIVCDEMYFDYNKKNNTKTFRKKPLSEIEAYILAETKFDTYMNKIECDFKKIFIANFKEDYPAYKNNFKKKLHNLSEANCE